MSDFFEIGGLSNQVADVAGNGPGGNHVSTGHVDTGKLRRKFNFGSRVSELAIAQDPFFRFVSQVSKRPTDDPQFKFTEKRHSFHKRYAYVVTYGSAFTTATTDQDSTSNTADTAWYGKMGCDYSNQGNLVNRYGQTISYATGDANTKPLFFMQDQLIKVPYSNTSGGAMAGYLLVKVNSVVDNGNYSNVSGTVVKVYGSGNVFYMGVPASVAVSATATKGASEESLAPYKTYVVGTAHAEGSGYPETWKDQPYSTNYGRTQIFKTSCAMTNTARATALNYESNEWARIWKEKLIEHKFDIEQTLLFGSQSEDYMTTQGAVDYINGYGNVFELDTDTKTSDGFLDDMSAFLDPRYNSSGATVFFCNTAVYNWMHKLGGYFANNLEISPNYRSEMALTGKSKVMGIDITTFSTPYGDMNVARNIHLDGTDVKMLGINMKNCAYRPLVGNGVNRDTSVYVGVQTLENSGIDRRVDLILTEAGMEWSVPESHAIWK
jgi:hypothetical protein